MGLRKKFKNLDLNILIPVLILSLFGAVMVYSSSSYLAAELNDFEYFFKRQMIYIALGLVILCVVFSININILKKRYYISFFFLLTLAALAYVLLFGEEVNGSRAWIHLGSFQIQPAEIAKFVIIWFLARYLANMQDQIDDNFLKRMIKPGLTILFALALIVVQPDMGTVVIILAICFIMLLSSGLDWKKSTGYLVLSILLTLGVFFLMKHYGSAIPFIKDYQLQRFEAFFDPFSLSDSAGLQLVNSYYALSRGGLWGVGLGNSIQKSGYLPEPHTDFIMSIVAEELGLVVTLIVIAIFYYLVARIYLVAIRAKDPFNSLMCIGIASMFLIQATINLGGVVGLLPITGVTFPFISYGGSSMIITYLSIAFVLNIQANEKMRKEEALYGNE